MDDTEPPNDAPAVVAGIIQTATRENLERTNNVLKPDTTYSREWTKFKVFIDQKRQEKIVPLPHDLYLTRDNVDLYFSTVIRDRECVPDSARRVVSALQFFANREEHVTAIGQPEFNVESPIVKQALEAQKIRYGEAVASRVTDPHKNLPTDVLSQDEYKRIHLGIIPRIDWDDFQWTYSICDATFVRFASAKILTFADIKLDVAHGPEAQQHGIGGSMNKSMISYVLRSGKHKDRHKHTQVVGVWRHRLWYRCNTGALAMSMLSRFNLGEDEINFYGGAGADAPSWWTKRILLRWKTYAPAYHAFNTLLTQLGISWSKVTHLRKSGMDHAGSLGVDDEHTGSMSKHKKGDKQKRYVPQLNAKVMLVMAGFRPNETYHIGRMNVPRPNNMSLEDAIDKLFPKYQTWMAQVESGNGDKSDAAKDFLQRTIPFLTHVILQDGIHWVKHFPHHTVSLILKQKFPNYEVWAMNARVALAEREQAAEVAEVDSLNAASRAAFANVTRRIEGIDITIRNNHEALMRHMLASNRRLPEVNQLLPGQQFYPAHEGVPQIRHNHRVLQLPNVNVALRNTPETPAVPAKMAMTFVQLLLQHEESGGLARFDNARKGHWPSKMQQAFGKRQYLYKRILLRARLAPATQEESERKVAAARRLDTERGGRTMPQFLEFLKDLDQNTQHRQPRRGRRI